MKLKDKTTPNKIQIIFSYSICLLLLLTYILMTENAMARKLYRDKTHMLEGEASWYGGIFNGRKTASGTIYSMHKHTAAHRTLPFGTVLEITDMETGKKTIACITDRGPVYRHRCIDLSYAHAKELDLEERGITDVKMRIVSDTTGKLLNTNENFYVIFKSQNNEEKVGPFDNFADASTMLEILQKTYIQPTIILISQP